MSHKNHRRNKVKRRDRDRFHNTKKNVKEELRTNSRLFDKQASLDDPEEAIYFTKKQHVSNYWNWD